MMLEFGEYRAITSFHGGKTWSFRILEADQYGDWVPVHEESGFNSERDAFETLKMRMEAANNVGSD